MKEDIIAVSVDIITLLKMSNRPLPVRDIKMYLDGPDYLTNFSLNYLGRKNIIRIFLDDNGEEVAIMEELALTTPLV